MVGSSPQLQDSDANTIIKHTHRSIASSYQWSFRKRDKLIQTVAPYSTGTVQVNQNSGPVTGAGTVWTAAMTGRQIRISGDNTFFWILSVNAGNQTLLLADGTLAAAVWVAPSALGVSYTIFQDQFAVPSDVAVILDQVADWPMAETSQAEVDATDPMRTSTGPPTVWYWARANITGSPQVESRYVGMWPVPDLAYTRRMPYLIEPPDMVTDTDLPVCPSEVLELAAGARCCMFIHAKTGDERWVKQALGFQQALMGTPGMLGVLTQSLQDDSHRFGLPTRLGGTRTGIDWNNLGSRDWALL